MRSPLRQLRHPLARLLSWMNFHRTKGNPIQAELYPRIDRFNLERKWVTEKGYLVDELEPHTL